MNIKIELTLQSADDIKSLLVCCLCTPVRIANAGGLELTEDNSVILPGWWADDGNQEVHYPDADSGAEAAQEYMDGCDWPAHEEECADEDGNGQSAKSGAGSLSIRAWRVCLDIDGDESECDSEWHDIDYPVDHEKMIRSVAGDNSCGDSPDDHFWIDEEDGVRGHGGTATSVRMRCRDCGLRRLEYSAGSQRNPGQASESVEYSWEWEESEEDEAEEDES